MIIVFKLAIHKEKCEIIIAMKAAQAAKYLNSKTVSERYRNFQDFDLNDLSSNATGSLAFDVSQHDEQTDFLTTFDFIYRFSDTHGHLYALIATVKGESTIKTPNYEPTAKDLKAIFAPVLAKASWLTAKISKLEIGYVKEYTFSPQQFHLDFSR